MKNILCVGPLPRRYLEQLLERYTGHLYWKANSPQALLQEVGSEIHAIVSTAWNPVRRDLIEALPNLEIICNYGVGYDNIDVAAATQRGVKVTNTPDVLTEDVADFAMTLVMALLRKVVHGDHFARSGRWQNKEKFSLGVSQRGKNLGIIGLGRIGAAIATRATGFGMDVLYTGPRQKQNVSYPYVDNVIDLAQASDVLVGACPGGEQTYHLINKDVLHALGENGYMVNIARGSVVDEGALCDALQHNVIAGAALDVFENEPHIPEALKRMDNVILQPHQASATVETRAAMAECVLQNLAMWFAEKKCLTAVN